MDSLQSLLQESLSAINALEYFKTEQTITNYTDSKYVKDGITSWINKWKINGWKTENKKPVKNKTLWIKLNNQIEKHNIIWKWVKGHDRNKYNEFADLLARKYIEDNSS